MHLTINARKLRQSIHDTHSLACYVKNFDCKQGTKHEKAPLRIFKWHKSFERKTQHITFFLFQYACTVKDSKGKMTEVVIN